MTSLRTGSIRFPPTVSRQVVVAVAPHGSQAALRQAAVASRRQGLPLHLVHIVQLTPAPDRVARLAADTTVREAHEVLWQAVEYARTLVAGAVPVTSELAHGPVVGRIVAAGRSSDLTVLQRGERPGRRTRSEDVCPQVAAGAPGEVVCVPWAWNGTRGAGTVTVGVGDPADCGRLLTQALGAAGELGAHLQVLHAVDPGTAVGAASQAAAQIDRVLLGAASGGPEVHTSVHVVEGRPGAVLQRASHTSELLVVGRHRPHWNGGSRLGSVARALVSDAECPVLLPAPV
jgi:nucleotide-binding universal stress UspA family protein